MADGFRKKGTKAWQDQGGKAATPQHPAKGPGWKQADAPKPGTGSRRIKIIGLLAGIGLAIGGIALLLYFIRDSPKPVFVVVAANPAKDADKLNVPIDPFGWQSARQLLNRTRDGNVLARLVTGENEGPAEIPAEPEELGKWVRGFPKWTNSKYDSLVIYLALHGGTDPDAGPVLFTGGTDAAGRAKRVAVKDIVAALKDHADANRVKVLIIDTGRLAPDAMYGQLSDDFVLRLKTGLNKEIGECPNLVVICGTDVDQRGNESEEHQSTAFAQFVIRGLHGEAASASSDLITARQLYEYIRRETSEWAERNRSRPQTPILLPDGQAGLELAEKMEVVRKPLAGVPAAPAATKFGDEKVVADLAGRWEEHDNLAARVPSPGAYTPRAWRRYRELLLRYEWAARAGDQPTCVFLASKLAAARSLIDAGSLKTDQFESANYSQGVWAAANGGTLHDPPPGTSLTVNLTKDPLPPDPRAPVGFTAGILDRLAGSGADDAAAFPQRLTLATAILSKEPFGISRRPAEVHLPVMVQHFYQDVLKPAPTAPPAGWQQAVAVKRQAERSAVGLPAPGKPLVDDTILRDSGAKPHPYAERLWPAVKDAIAAADRDRREGEDRLFGTAAEEHRLAAGKLKAAGDRYENSANVARSLRTALLVRDRVFADLPFLTRWVTSVGPSSPHADKLAGLWNDAHKLGRDIDTFAPPADPNGADEFAKLVASVAERFDKLFDAYKAECALVTTLSSVQDAWTKIQVLLPSALIDQKTRTLLLKASWEKSYDLETKGVRQPAAAVSPEELQLQSRKAAAFRGRTARATLGTEVLDAQGGESLPKADSLDDALRELAPTPSTDSAKWCGLAAKTGAALGGHMTALGQKAAPPTKSLNAPAERASRAAVAIDADDVLEPAAVNQRLRWRDLLAGLAERTATDHWYDESGQPYFDRAAKAYLNDAKKAVDGIPDADYAPPPGSILLKLASPLPRLSGGEFAPIEWTSDRERVVKLGITVPANFPVQGHAAAFGSLNGQNVLKYAAATASANSRDIRPLSASAAVEVDSRVETVNETGEESNANCAAAATFYFRGQNPRQEQPIRVNRRPDLILSDPLPNAKERPVSVAIEADEKLKLGTVVILLDMSGSMVRDLKGDAIPGGPNAWKNAPSKFNIALSALKDLLKSLPEGTPLRIRVFADAEKDQGSRLVYPDPKEPADVAKVIWNANLTEPLETLIEKRLRKKIEPQGFTPLVSSIIEAAEADFHASDPPGSKTLIVLTDGIEQHQQALPSNDDMVKARDTLRRAFDRERLKSVSLQVVQLALGDEEKKLADTLFRDVTELNDLDCNVWRVTNTDPTKSQSELTAALLDTIWPKLKLRKVGGRLLDDFPRTGWPSRPMRSGREGLYWSRTFEPDRYKVETQSLSDANTPEFLTFPGDRVILRFEPEKSGGPRLQIRRTLYADYLKELGRSVTVRERDKKWSLAASENWINTRESIPRYGALVCVENTTREILQQTRPEMLWWDVAPVDADATARRTVKVTKLHAYPAPTWQIEASDWPRAKDKDYAGGRVRFWVPSDAVSDPNVQKSDRDTLPVISDAQPTTDPVVNGNKLKVWFGFKEKHALGPDGLQDCLVVRVSHALNKPVQARLSGLRGLVNVEHRYYKRSLPDNRREFAEYTAIFGPVTKAELEDGLVKVQFLPVELAPPSDQVMELTPPRPQDKEPREPSYRPPQSTK